MSQRETCFCWCFWSFEIPVPELVDSDALLVRAMDEALALQPKEMYWSVLGMMNNPWYRLVIEREGDQMTFVHPTQPALMPGGWMEQVKNSGGDLSNGRWGTMLADEVAKPKDTEAKAEISMVKPGVNTIISIDDLQKQIGRAHV